MIVVQKWMDVWNFGYVSFLSHLSWSFMINNLNKTFDQELQGTINSQLEKWAGIGKTVDNGLLVWSKQKFGLGLTSIFYYFQRMQLVKCKILQDSKDPSIR